MKVTLEFFGVLERLAGKSLEIEVPSVATVGDALAALATLRGDLAPQLRRTGCAIGDALVLRTATLGPDTRLALLPPVAGG